MKPLRLMFAAGLALLSLPYLLLLFSVREWTWPESGELAWALKNSIAQAAGSAALALVSAVPLALGLLRVPTRWRGGFAWALLGPSFFPPLFLLLAFLSWVDPFPVGLPGIILIQGFMNSGLVAVLVTQSFERKLAGLAEAAETMGASRRQFFGSVLPLIRPDLASALALVFAMSFASFSIPFVVGGGKATTLEILIYEKIRISGEWGQALSLSLIQLLIVGVFVILPRASFPVEETRARGLNRWGLRAGVAAVILYLAMFWLPLLRGIPAGWSALAQLPGIFPEIASLAGPSLGIAGLTGVLCLCLFLALAFGGPDSGVPRLMRGWVAPSTALVGFAFLFHFGDGSWSGYLAGVTLLFLPGVYRMGMDRAVESLADQSRVARTLGASEFLIWREILVPQLWRPACFLSGIAGLWALGEFALGRVILGGTRTWALLSESLMSSYRIEAGLGVSSLILFSGSILFLAFWGVGHVRR